MPRSVRPLRTTGLPVHSQEFEPKSTGSADALGNPTVTNVVALAFRNVGEWVRINTNLPVPAHDPMHIRH